MLNAIASLFSRPQAPRKPVYVSRHRVVKVSYSEFEFNLATLKCGAYC